jgi:hypothetical protein
LISQMTEFDIKPEKVPCSGMTPTLRSAALVVISMMTVVAMSCDSKDPGDTDGGAGMASVDGGTASADDGRADTAGVEATEQGGGGSLSPAGGANGGMSPGAGTASTLGGAAGSDSSEPKTCKDLETCCNSLSGNDQKTCLGNLATGQRTGEFLCDFYYEFFEFAGKCP